MLRQQTFLIFMKQIFNLWYMYLHHCPFIIWLSSVTLSWPSTNLPEQNFQMNNCARLFWNPCKNVEVMTQASSIYDHFIIWPLSVTLTFNLPEQMNCAKLFWNPCINIEVMAQTSSIHDHFIIWPSRVTLTLNLPEQIFQMALLLLKENNCAKLFWNPCIIVEVMARTSSIFIIWPSGVTLTLNLPGQIFPMALLLLKKNNCAKLSWNPCIYGHFIIWPLSVTLTFNLPEQCFKWHYYSLGRTTDNCAELFWNPCINVEVMARTNPDRHTHNAYSANWSCNNVSLTASGLEKNYIYRTRYNT